MRFLFLGEALVVDLLNTVIAQDGRVVDLLATRLDVVRWGEGAGVAPRGSLGRRARLGHEPGALRAFREALRGGLVAWAATGKPRPRLLALLNRQLARDPEVLNVGASAGRAIMRRQSQGGALDRLYAAVARSAAELLAHGEPGRLRKCANPACRLMFYDVSKAGRRRWCSMRTCGARAKVRAFYHRLKPHEPRTEGSRSTGLE